MTLSRIADWLDKTLRADAFDDLSNNGVQIDREGEDVSKVAFGVDASVRFVEAAADAGAQLCVVHHGISWGGGVKRISGGVGRVVRAAVSRNVALYASHLPLDAHLSLGNNAGLARALRLVRTRPAFSYHGNVIGRVGFASRTGTFRIGGCDIALEKGMKVGVCSGGAGSFAEEAKDLGCDIFVTGEADWGETVAAANAGAGMVCAGHYETETFGVAALAKAMEKALGVETALILRGDA